MVHIRYAAFGTKGMVGSLVRGVLLVGSCKVVAKVDGDGSVFDNLYFKLS